MRRLAILGSLILWSAISWSKDASQLVPQTARQALMEMCFSKQSGTFMKHLPAATRAAFEQSGVLTNLQQYSTLAGQFSQGKGFQSFETGSVLFVTDDPRTGQKVETIVEGDSLQGDQDDIELSFQTYKGGQPQSTVFMPRITFAMKLESGVWTLNQVSLTIHLPLADPSLLKSITDGLKAHATNTAQIQMQPQAQTPGRTLGTDATTLASMRTILSAEATYAATYPAAGFTCTLSDLDGFGGGEPNEHQAMLINSGLASGKLHGYIFSLSDCGGSPATTFHLTASPSGSSFGRRAFCADQSASIRSSDDGLPASCQSGGAPVQ